MINHSIKDGSVLSNLPPSPLKHGLFPGCGRLTHSRTGSALRPCERGEDISAFATGHWQLCAPSTTNHLRFKLQQGQFTCWAQSYSTLFSHIIFFFPRSAFSDKIKLLRASVLMESSYLPPRRKAIGTGCNTRWTSSCCAISEDLKTWKALCWHGWRLCC